MNPPNGLLCLCLEAFGNNLHFNLSDWNHRIWVLKKDLIGNQGIVISWKDLTVKICRSEPLWSVAKNSASSVTFIEGFPCVWHACVLPKPSETGPHVASILQVRKETKGRDPTASFCSLVHVILTSLGLSFLLCDL